MQFLSSAIEHYAEAHTEVETMLLQELQRETHLNVLMPRMLSGHLQGRLLSLISKLLNPKYVLEIGTFTGYSALCLAEGLAPDGVLHTIDNNEELNDIALSYFNRSDFSKKIVKHTGDASQIVPLIPHLWDLVFIDADKRNYKKYYEMVLDRVRPGGLIVADNVLWSGKVINTQVPDNDKDTISLKAF